MTILVTGATGLLGNNVVRVLRESGVDVRVLVRAASDPRPLRGVDVERQEGDIRDPVAVSRACRGVEAVVHAAALVHIGWTQLDIQRAINVEGTRNVVTAARAEGARLVHISTVDTLAAGGRRQVTDEETVERAGKVPCGYVVTKREAERLVREEIERGLDASIVHPGFVLGPWDWKPSSGRMLLAVARRFTPLAPRGGISVCDARDVAAGIVAVWRRGQPGRSYILAGHNLPFLDLWQQMARATCGRPPWFRAGPILRSIGGGWGDLTTRLTGRESDVNSASVAMSSLFHYYSSDRAVEEVGYSIRPLEQTLDDAWHWFMEHGFA